MVCSGSQLRGWKPVIISKCMGTKWCDRKFEIQKKAFLDKNGSEIEITRRVYEHFVLYSNTRAWSNMFIWQWEAERLSLYLKKNYPSCKVALLGRVSN